MTKQEVMERLREHPEDDYPLWNLIADLFTELDELEKLSAYSIADAERGRDWLHQRYGPRLHELELKFGV